MLGLKAKGFSGLAALSLARVSFALVQSFLTRLGFGGLGFWVRVLGFWV